MKAQRTPIKHREHGESFENIVVNKEPTKSTMKTLRKHCEPGVFFENIVVNKETTKNTMKALRTLRKTSRTW
jgi:hypothetical protein